MTLIFTLDKDTKTDATETSDITPEEMAKIIMASGFIEAATAAETDPMAALQAALGLPDAFDNIMNGHGAAAFEQIAEALGGFGSGLPDSGTVPVTEGGAADGPDGFPDQSGLMQSDGDGYPSFWGAVGKIIRGNINYDAGNQGLYGSEKLRNDGLNDIEEGADELGRWFDSVFGDDDTGDQGGNDGSGTDTGGEDSTDTAGDDATDGDAGEDNGTSTGGQSNEDGTTTGGQSHPPEDDDGTTGGTTTGGTSNEDGTTTGGQSQPADSDEDGCEDPDKAPTDVDLTEEDLPDDGLGGCDDDDTFLFVAVDFEPQDTLDPLILTDPDAGPVGTALPPQTLDPWINPGTYGGPVYTEGFDDIG